MSKIVFISQSGSLFAIARKLREEPLFFAAVLRRSSPVRKPGSGFALRFWGRSPRPVFLTVAPQSRRAVAYPPL